MKKEKTLSISDIYFWGVLLLMLGVMVILSIFGVVLPYWVKFFWVVLIPPLIPRYTHPNGKFTTWFWTKKW